MGEMFETVVDFFKQLGWPTTPVGSQPILRIGDYAGEHGRFTCFAQVVEEQQQFVFYSLCPIVVPEGKRTAMGEFVNRANYGLILGNFEMDYQDGEVRYKTSATTDGAPLNATLLGQLVQVNVLTLDKYLPGIMNVIYGQTTPADAVVQIENP